MKVTRSSGILLHPTSLPGRYGIGDLGGGVYRFVDFLAETRQRLWQVLPLGPTGQGNSPYQCVSVFAGNTLLISLDKLVNEKLLDPADLEQAPSLPSHRVDYAGAYRFKVPLLEKSFENFELRASAEQKQQFNAFAEQNASWLDDYALFMALKQAHGQVSWNEWEEGARRRYPNSLEHWRKTLAHQFECHRYQQWQFFKQWSQLKSYCNERGISLIGDIPIYVALDSAEVWSHPDVFYLDVDGRPILVAGVPPDYFSKTGQLWGNPLYRWDVMARQGYAWWVARLRATLALVDIVRLDHFRGFESYWEIPATEKTAINGRWVPGPGAELFKAIQNALGELPIIAEDLGIITTEVDTLRDQFGFPTMRVLQFSFTSGHRAELYRPHNYSRNSVAYTGTHDNDTTIGWFRQDVKTLTEAEVKERQLALEYAGCDGREINWDFIRLALMSTADRVIIPLQDVLGLGSEGRMNTPGTTEGNWQWRFTFDMLTEQARDRLKRMTEIYGR